MKKKLLVLLAFVLVCATLVTMLAISATAADEEIVITYQEKHSLEAKRKPLLQMQTVLIQ